MVIVTVVIVTVVMVTVVMVIVMMVIVVMVIVVRVIVVRVIALLMVCTTWDWQHLSLQVTWSQIVPTAVVSSHCCCQHSPEPV